ncbi:hypothetical protein [Endozoicomonas arenosclerae]|uniref:hypothetical protein n=1 Tax=Endozoicomonas arenosclerae TaxID=1633495 RepID=UPI00129469E1|nr:hypothetical protein [Endozoicomonas arenosclerae]
MSKTHESCHEAMRDRHHYDPFHFPKHLECKTILETKEGAFMEKTVFIPPNILEYTCRSTAEKPSKNTPFPDCLAQSKIATSTSRAIETPGYPIILIKDDIYLHPDYSFSELMTYALYNGGNLVEIFFHSMLYLRIWTTFQKSDSFYAFPAMTAGMTWNTIEIYKHGLHSSNTHHDHEFSVQETTVDGLSTIYELKIETPHAFAAYSSLRGGPSSIGGAMLDLKELAFFGLIWMNAYTTSTSWIPYFFGNHDHEHCPDLASAPQNSSCVKQTEEIFVLLDDQ